MPEKTTTNKPSGQVIFNTAFQPGVKFISQVKHLSYFY